MEETTGNEIRLSQMSHGSGCGCKIAPEALEAILQNTRSTDDQILIVGNHSSDDASVVDLGDGRGLIQTTDFFIPIVDDPETFGKIAATNALSDVYAMGGRPLTALSILGWPVEQLGTEMAAQVLKGASSICGEAGIQISGGHSIDSKEPFFGLSVSGIVELNKLKRNNSAKAGDLLFLTKPIGTGILATAVKRGICSEEDINEAVQQMCQLNDVGAILSELEDVHAITDVTGFGLAGHLLEVCEGSGLHAELSYDWVPILLPELIERLLKQFVMPDNTMRNFKAYGDRITKLYAAQLQLLCDPQTSGGLLICVAEKEQQGVQEILEKAGLYSTPIGRLVEPSGEHTIRVLS